MNVTLLPWQMIVPGEAETETDGVTIGLTVIVIPLEVTGLFETQVAFEVIVQVTTFPFASVVDENEVLLVPVLNPLTFH